MKLKVLMMALGFSMGVFGAYAQKGVDSGTQYGIGEDSVRCTMNVSLFIPYAKAGNYKDAYEFWKIVYDECPAATKDVYLYGVRIVAWEIDNATDAAKKSELIDKLMAVYDKRVKYFGDDARYGKDWIVARKAQDYIQYKGENADNKLLYGWLKETVDEYGNKTDALAVSLYMFSSLRLLQADPNFKADYIADYLKCSAIYDAQIAAAQAENNEKEMGTLVTYKQGLDANFVNSGAADCETLQNLYAAKVEERKTDMDFLTETLNLLRRLRCQEIDVYFAASRYVHINKPTAESAVGLGKQAYRDKEYDTAIKYFEEAANLEVDAKIKADDYFMIAAILNEQNNFPRARQYCLKALEYNPNYGAAYIMIGLMYAGTVKNIFPNDPILLRAAYNVAIDKFEKAKQVDPGVAEDANRHIATYRQHLPSTEEVFMHPDLEKGKPFTVGGWIGERTIIR